VANKGTRDNFSAGTRSFLRRAANERCCLCDKPTSGAIGGEAVLLGRAAHIEAASPLGARFNPRQTSEQRRHADNGLWLCSDHADVVDDATSTYSVDLLKQARDAHYARIQGKIRIGRPTVLRAVQASARDWPATLDGRSDGVFCEPPELDTLLARLTDDATRLVALLGGPGSGKSAALARLLPRLEKHATVVALRVDGMPPTVRTPEALAQWMGLESDDPTYALQSWAIWGPTVIVLDQLDNLSDLTDRHTERLAVLLQFVRDALALPNLTVLLSCRDFDFQHDHHLSSLNPVAIRLSPIAKHDVESLLVARGIQLPDPHVEVLRTPQHLKVFLQLVGDGPPVRALETYHGMLGELFRRHDREPERALLDELAARISEAEVPMVPEARVREPTRARSLEAAGILRRERQCLGFAHQTLYDYARARTFLGQSLLDYVREHDGIPARPVVWNALTFLRATHEQRYVQAITGIVASPEVRWHLRALVVEFVGSQLMPTPEEVRLGRTLVDGEELRFTFLCSIRGDSRWFEAFGAPRVSQWFHCYPRAPLQVLLANGLQSSGTSAAGRRAALALIVEHGLLTTPSGPGFFLGAISWDATSFEILGPTLERKEAQAALRMDLHRLVEALPAQALGLIRAQLIAAVDPAPNDHVLDPTPPASVRELLLSQRFNLADLARREPAAFLTLAEPIAATQRSRRPIPGCFDGVLIFPDADHRTLFDALTLAARTLAARDGDAFRSFVAGAATSEFDLTQATIAAGLAVLGDGALVADFLCGDPRRWSIAGLRAPNGATMELLQAIAPRLSADDTARIEASLFALPLTPPRAQEDDRTAEQRRRLLNQDLARTTGMLQLLPAGHLSQRARQHCSSFPSETRIPEIPEVIRFEPVESPMSVEQLVRAQNTDIRRLLDQLPDSVDWKSPHRRFVASTQSRGAVSTLRAAGTNIELTRELAPFAQRCPDRARQLLADCHADGDERAAAELLSGLRKAELPPAELVDLIEERDAAGLHSLIFREPVATLLRDEDFEPHGPRIVVLLQRWVVEALDDLDQPDPENSRWFGQGPSKEGEYRAFDDIEPDGLPDGLFSLVHSLGFHLTRQDPAGERALLERLAPPPVRPGHTRLWCALLPHLVGHRCWEDETWARAFLASLFAALPTVLASHGAALFLLLDPVRRFQGPEFAAWEDQLGRSGSWFGQHFRGDLLCFRALRGARYDPPRHSDARPLVRLRVAEEPERLGIIARAAASWDGAPVADDELCETLLLEALAQGGTDATTASQAFDRWRPTDDATGARLLAAALDQEATRDRLPWQVFRELHVLARHEPALALSIAENALDSVEQRGVTLSAFDIGRPFTALAITLSRSHSHRDVALDLLERLVRLRVYGCAEALAPEDRRAL
jgi:hypothetical protein